LLLKGFGSENVATPWIAFFSAWRNSCTPLTPGTLEPEKYLRRSSYDDSTKSNFVLLVIQWKKCVV